MAAILGGAWLAGAFEFPDLPVRWSWIAGLDGAACVVLAPFVVWFALTED